MNGATVPGKNDTEIIQAVIAIPGSMIGLAISYFWGARYDREHGEAKGAGSFHSSVPSVPDRGPCPARA